MNDYKPFYQNEISDFIKQELAKQNKPLDLIYTGFSPHDCESWYKCPKCGEQYGSWSFVNGGVTVTDDKFKCHKCETILYVPEQENDITKKMTKQEALDRIKDIFNKNRQEFINQIDKDAIKIAYKALEERVDEEKSKIEIEPDMDRCHLIGNTYFIDTDEDANIYIYKGVRIIEKYKTQIRYEVFCGKTPYVYLDLYDACKFIDNEYNIKCRETEYNEWRELADCIKE